MNVVGLVVMPGDVEVPQVPQLPRTRAVGLLDRVAMRIDLRRVLRRHAAPRRRRTVRRVEAPRRDAPMPIC